MITISLCMIVKNEEAVLARCLDSLQGLMDEIIIVDTGSTDDTKEIARRYTDKVYDFTWVDDFAAARNFAFEKATMDYIYSADADEILLPEHRRDFQILKQTLLPEIEIVQMHYGNQLSKGSVYNFDMELRPKLYKRLRTFIWQEPIHEAVRLEPVIYDSDVIITHAPEHPHGCRDLEYLRKHALSGAFVSKRLHHMYAMELYLSGDDEDFIKALPFFETSLQDENRGPDEMAEAALICAKAALIKCDLKNFLKYSTRLVAGEGCSEIGMLLGEFFEKEGDMNEARIWYNAALNGAQPILKASSGDTDPQAALERLDIAFAPGPLCIKSDNSIQFPGGNH